MLLDDFSIESPSIFGNDCFRSLWFRHMSACLQGKIWDFMSSVQNFILYKKPIVLLKHGLDGGIQMRNPSKKQIIIFNTQCCHNSY